MARREPIPLLGSWTDIVRSSAHHTVSLAFMAVTRPWGSGANRRRRTTRLLTERDRADTEIASLEEELASRTPAGVG